MGTNEHSVVIVLTYKLMNQISNVETCFKYHQMT